MHLKDYKRKIIKKIYLWRCVIIMEKKMTIKESFNLGQGWHLMIFAILAMLVTNAGVNDGLNIALPAISEVRD